MLTTNLLPPGQKQLVRFEEWRRIARFFGLGAGSVLSIAIILLAPSYLPLYYERQELAHALVIAEQTAKTVDAEALKRQVHAARNSMDRIARSVQRIPKASRIFDTIFADRKGVFIRSIAVDPSGEVRMAGGAQTRRDLLDFERALRESDIFHEITSPLSNIVKESNIMFSLRGTLKKEYSL